MPRRKTQKYPLLRFLYWITFGWIFWLIKVVFSKVPILLTKTSSWLHKRLSASGHTYSLKTVNSAVTSVFIVIVLGFCGLTALHKEQKQESNTVQTAQTEQNLPNQTLTFTPSLTPFLTPTFTLIPPTPTPLFWGNLSANCVSKNNPVEIARVLRVTDGDTIVVEMDGQEYRVRYIGIDSPENGEYFEPESTLMNEELVLHQTVYMVKDVSDVDSFGRLLRYVFVGDIFVNYELVRQGAALVGHWPPDTACEATFTGAQNAAQTTLAGLWSKSPTEPPDTDRSGVIPIDPDPTSAPVGGCDPSYPTVCIPPPPPDLDCGDITFRRFQVIPPDSHNFDGDGNGIGCESG